MKGVKYDEEKLMWSLLDFNSIEDLVKVLQYGAKKYSLDNWKYVEPKSRYFDACLRHIIAWKQGEQNDSESGLSHLSHAMACLMFLNWSEKQKKLGVSVEKVGSKHKLTPKQIEEMNKSEFLRRYAYLEREKYGKLYGNKRKQD